MRNSKAFLAFSLLVCALLLGGMGKLVPSIGPISTQLQIVATGGTVPTNQASPSAAEGIVSRIPIVFGGDTACVVFSYDNASIDANGAWLSPSQAFQILGVGFEQSSPAKTVPVTFAHAVGKTLSIGADDIQTDELCATAFGLNYFPRNSLYYLRTQASVAAAGTYPINVPASGLPNAKVFKGDPTTATNQVYSTGQITAPPGWSTTATAYSASLILGKYVNPTGKLSVYAIGDSWFGADSGAVPVCGGSYQRRASCDSNGLANNVIALATAFHGGINSSQIKNNTQVLAKLRYANVLHLELGANDIQDGNSAATVFANDNSIWTSARGFGVQRIVQSKPGPRTTWTGTPGQDFTNTVDQTYVSASWQPGGVASQLTTLLYAAVPGTIDAVVDFNAVIGDPTLQLKWLTSTTPSFYTADGVHPEGPGAALMGQQFRSTLQSLTVNYLLDAANDNAPMYLNRAA